MPGQAVHVPGPRRGPWNNNAENAIKRFAHYREVASPPLYEEGLRHYLVLLGLYQTCRCKGANVQRFLMSGERDLDHFCRKGRAREPLPLLQLYPEGYVPPHFDSNRKTTEPAPMGSGCEPEAVCGAGS